MNQGPDPPLSSHSSWYLETDMRIAWQSGPCFEYVFFIPLLCAHSLSVWLAPRKTVQPTINARRSFHGDQWSEKREE